MAAFVAAAAGVRGADWPHYRGPTHNGISTESIRTDWGTQAPKVLWRKPMPAALSSFAVAGKVLFTQARRTSGSQDLEYCVALDADTGNELWSARVGIADYPNGGVDFDPRRDGPRSTPSVRDGRVFVLSSYLQLVCLDAATGRELWSHDLQTEYNADVIPWQNAASPVLVDGLVIVNGNGNAGERILAFRQNDGSLAWKAHNDRMTHSTPVLATIGGVEQVVFFTQAGLVGLAPGTGAALWRHALNYNGTSVAASPVVFGNQVYGSRAYPGLLSRALAGAVVVRVEGSNGQFTASPVWTKVNQLMNHWCSPVEYQGYIYGMFGQSSLNFRCVDAANGDTKWAEEQFGYGSVTVVNDKLVVLGDEGELVLVDPSPEAYRELARLRPVQTKCWNSPAVSGGRIYVRGLLEAAAIDVSIAAAVPPLRLEIGGLAGSLSIWVGAQDGAPLDPAIGSKIGVFATPELPSANWQRLEGSLNFSEGKFRLENVPRSGERQFFRTQTP